MIVNVDQILQREPHSPNIWGMAPPNTRVGLNISLGEEFLHVTDNVLGGEDGVWTISLGSWPAGVGYSVHIMLEDTGEIISLTDIAFGDVWVCSGQSNMVLKVSVKHSFKIFSYNVRNFSKRGTLRRRYSLVRSTRTSDF